MTKPEARRWARETAAALAPLRAQHGAAIAAAVRALGEYKAARVVCAFAPMDDEPDIRPLLEAAAADGKTLCLPRCQGRGVMTMHACRPDALAPDRCGIPAPPPDAPEIPAADIDLCLVPCLAADETGARLGRGAGYYDRFAPLLRPGVALVVCRAALIVPRLPSEAHDARFARAVTEQGVRALG